MTNSTGAPGEITGILSCRFCNAVHLRRSRFRMSDVWGLFLFHWPVRCLRCNKRQYISWENARLAIPSNTPHDPERRSKESWETYTSSKPAKPIMRPNRMGISSSKWQVPP